jgi:AraC-like DNA-binding protein
MLPQETREILDPALAARRFTLDRRKPAPALERLVKRYWIVRWDLAGRFSQETLPHPCVNVAFGTHQPGVHGVGRRRFVADLHGAGWVLGVKFRAGAFRDLLGRDVATLTDRALPVAEVFGPAGDRLTRDVDGADCDDARISLVERFLLERAPEVPPDAALACEIVDGIEADPCVLRVEHLASRFDLGTRRLERLFRAHVGVSPKWVIRAFRIQQAAERVKAGAPADWAALAQELGYYDQPHFIRDFRAQVGQTPSGYAARCAASAVADAPVARVGA